MSAFTQTFEKHSPLSHSEVYTFVNQVYAFMNLYLMQSSYNVKSYQSQAAFEASQ